MTAGADAAAEAYAEARSLLAEPAMAAVGTHGFTILYGPPIQRPDLFLISFQGGGAAPVVYERWPERFRYLDNEHKPGNAFKFGRNLCVYSRQAGLYDVLATSTVAVPAVFPCGPGDFANCWLKGSGAYARWRRFSVEWVARMVDAFEPKAVLVFGKKAAEALGLSAQWRDVEVNPNNNFMTFGRARYGRTEAIFCGHLSQGYVGSAVVRSLRVAADVAGEAGSSPEPR